MLRAATAATPLLARARAAPALRSAPRVAASSEPAPARLAATMAPRTASVRARGLANDASTSASSTPPPTGGEAGAGAGDAPKPPADERDKEIAELKARVAKLTQEASDYKERTLYALAEAENARRIAARDVDQARQFAVQSFAKSLLDVADNLERAVASFPADKVGASEDVRALLVGVQGTEKELKKAFKAVGVESFGDIGDACDPNKFEALFQIPDATRAPNTVVQVLRKGYTLKGRVIRPAQVGSSRQA